MSKEQLSLSLRWVESDYTIHEDFIGLVEVESTSAATLFSVLKDCLVRLSLPVSFLCGQALTVYYMACCLNLCLQGSSSDHIRAGNFEDTLKSVAMAKCFFTRHRSEESFSKLYREAVEEASYYGYIYL